MHHCDADAALGKRGMRNTKDRHQILSLFLEGRAWSVAEVHRRLRRMDLSTVYRNVNALVSAGILAEAHVHGGEARFELADRPHHDHVVCERCDAAECVPCPVSTLGMPHVLELFGRCSACR